MFVNLLYPYIFSNKIFCLKGYLILLLILKYVISAYILDRVMTFSL